MNRTQRFGDTELDVTDPGLTNERIFPLLRAFIQDTFNACTFHRERWKRAGLQDGRISSLEDFEKLPRMGPDEASIGDLHLLPDHYPAGLRGRDGLNALPPDSRLAKKFTTSGSTGKPKAVYYTAQDWRLHAAAFPRVATHIPREWMTRCFNAFNPGHIAGKFTEDCWNSHGFTVENRHFSATTPEQVLHQLTSGLREVGGFNFLCLPPSLPKGAVAKGITLSDLLDLDQENYIGSRIRVILTTGAPRDNPEHRLKQRVWEANELARAGKTILFEFYGAAEVGLIAAECEHNDGLHLRPGLVFIEVIDPATGRHVADGERGLVCVTGLHQGSRYVRYLVGDEVTFDARPCPCGAPTPKFRGMARVLDRERIRQGCAAG
ncbi:MAG: phenylacetate--CoA ligase family protein [Hyalangium sp.]|uniref:phenylacetate--CoA ligase family protein n=1 Tax=Hyalangium sp. TaxID=2028555 RepID=UPI00389A23DA